MYGIKIITAQLVHLVQYLCWIVGLRRVNYHKPGSFLEVRMLPE